MLGQLLKHIQAEKLFEPNARLLCAVSGGIDSMVMLQLLHAAGFELAVAHCNFGLRAEASDQDEIFVKQRCQELGIQFFSKKFETENFAATHQVSTQMAARSLRYAWFDELLNKHSYDFLLTAHHLNDVLETILLNLSKGTGLAGLRGIKPKQGHIVRPLLFATRLQIENYAQDQNLTWREDASNASDKYQRNLIRHQVVPLLQKINPNLEQTLGNNLLRLASTERVFEQAVANLKNQSVQTKDGNVLIQLPITEVALLHELLKDFGFNFQQSKTIFAGQNGLVGKQFFSEKYTATLDRNCLIVSVLKLENNFELYIENTSLEDDFMVNTPAFSLGFSKKNTENVSTPDFAKIDASQLIWPLKLRTWQAGDVFCPLGMKGRKKKVSDFLIDLKIPRNLKKDTYILQNGNDAIIWIIGLRLDERFKIQENTQEVLTVRIYDGNHILT